MMMMMMRRTAMTGTTTRRTLQVRTQSSPVHACPLSHALRAGPAPKSKARDPQGKSFILVGRQAHAPVQFSSAQCTAQSTSRAVPTPITAPALLHPLPARGGRWRRRRNSTAKALSPLQLAGAAVIIASKDIHTQGDHLVIYASSSTQRSGRHRHSPWTHCSSLPAHRATARTVAATTWRRLPPTTST